MRELTPAAVAANNAQETGEVYLPMTVFTSDTWDDPVRFVRNGEDVTHQGDVFNSFPFDITLPDEGEESNGVVDWIAVNVGDELLDSIRALTGPLKGSVFWILASDPDNKVLGPYDLEIRGIEYDALKITGSMTVEPILDAVFGSMSMDGTNAPGLF